MNADDREWFERNDHHIIWHVIALDELLLFLSLPERERHLFKRLSAYFRDAGPDRPFVDSQQRFPMSFRDYLAAKYPGRTESSRIGIDVVIENVLSEVNRFFVGPPEGAPA